MPIKHYKYYKKQNLFFIKAALVFAFFSFFVFSALTFSNTVEIVGIDSKCNRKLLNSQNSTFLSDSLVDVKRINEFSGGIDISFQNDVLKLKNSNILQKTFNEEKVEKNIHQLKRYYTVQSGDTISGIAHEFGVKPQTIVWANNLKKDFIKVGQELKIPPKDGLYYTIKKGDTIEKLAKTYKTTSEKIYEFNELKKGDVLKLSKEIFIPDGKKIIKVKIKSAPKHDYIAKSNKKTKKKYSGYALSKTGSKYWRYSSKTSYGYWTHPLPGSYRVRGLSRTHHGVDMASPIGTPILAAASGTVIKAASFGWNHGCGKMVYLQHSNGAKTLYCHASKVLVKKGQHIVKGQVIAKVGSTGKSTGPHLHFEVRGAKNPF